MQTFIRRNDEVTFRNDLEAYKLGTDGNHANVARGSTAIVSHVTVVGYNARVTFARRSGVALDLFYVDIKLNERNAEPTLDMLPYVLAGASNVG